MCKSCNGNCYECLKCAAEATGKEKYGTIKINGITFSLGNDKTGNCISVSLNNDFCDPSWPCYKFCYAKKLANFRKDSMKVSYDRNTEAYRNDPTAYFDAVKKACVMAREMGIGFRYHIDGEMPNYEYFCEAVRIAKETGEETILMTKRYEFVNRYCDLNGGKESIPVNLHVGFSLQHEGQVIDNPYGFPTRGFIPKKESTDGKVLCPNQTAKKAGLKWTCETCLQHKTGCFGDQSLNFMQH